MSQSNKRLINSDLQVQMPWSFLNTALIQCVNPVLSNLSEVMSPEMYLFKTIKFQSLCQAFVKNFHSPCTKKKKIVGYKLWCEEILAVLNILAHILGETTLLRSFSGTSDKTSTNRSGQRKVKLLRREHRRSGSLFKGFRNWKLGQIVWLLFTSYLFEIFFKLSFQQRFIKEWTWNWRQIEINTVYITIKKWFWWKCHETHKK